MTGRLGLLLVMTLLVPHREAWSQSLQSARIALLAPASTRSLYVASPPPQRQFTTRQAWQLTGGAVGALLGVLVARSSDRKSAAAGQMIGLGLLTTVGGAIGGYWCGGKLYDYRRGKSKASPSR